MKLKSVSTYCQSAMSAGLIYTRDESGESSGSILCAGR